MFNKSMCCFLLKFTLSVATRIPTGTSDSDTQSLTVDGQMGSDCPLQPTTQKPNKASLTLHMHAEFAPLSLSHQS